MFVCRQTLDDLVCFLYHIRNVYCSIFEWNLVLRLTPNNAKKVVPAAETHIQVYTHLQVTQQALFIAATLERPVDHFLYTSLMVAVCNPGYLLTHHDRHFVFAYSPFMD